MIGVVICRLVEALAHSDEDTLAPQWAGQAAEALELDGVAATLVADSAELVWFSDEVSEQLENTQFTLGEGPGLDAAREGAMCLLADVRETSDERWAAFLPAISGLPVRAVFAFPLRLGALRVGAFTGYRATPGMISRELVDDALILCDALTEFVLRLHLSHPEPGVADTRPGPAGLMALHRAEVHQATGMVATLLDISMPAALARLRAEAFAANRDINDIAHAVIHHELRLAAHSGGPEGGKTNPEASSPE
ncbi:hypothetical protein [Streptomyces sp. NPDC053560]|uniref:hypothetical protein n=1 Tax=Streptomyces sp. NPDC053560 TaxID=3365711 RepID=UPI0037D2CB16